MVKLFCLVGALMADALGRVGVFRVHRKIYSGANVLGYNLYWLVYDPDFISNFILL